MWEKIVRWFIKYAWPVIQKILLRALEEAIEWLFKIIKEYLGRWSESKASDADLKAQEADNEANISISPEEAGEHVVEGRVWRQVAKKIRKDSIELQQKMEEIQKKAGAKVEERVNKMTPDEVFELGKKDLSLKQGIKMLSLPLPDYEI